MSAVSIVFTHWFKKSENVIELLLFFTGIEVIAEGFYNFVLVFVLMGGSLLPMHCDFLRSM